MIRDRIMTFYEDDDIDTLKTTMAKTRVRYFPVTDGYGNYKGLVSRRNYINARKKQLILVDHNERTQSVDGVENAEILEIIDHHRIANIETMILCISEISHLDVLLRSSIRCTKSRMSR